MGGVTYLTADAPSIATQNGESISGVRMRDARTRWLWKKVCS